jgi:hypothetical protein
MMSSLRIVGADLLLNPCPHPRPSLLWRLAAVAPSVRFVIQIDNFSGHRWGDSKVSGNGFAVVGVYLAVRVHGSKSTYLTGRVCNLVCNQPLGRHRVESITQPAHERLATLTENRTVNSASPEFKMFTVI